MLHMQCVNVHARFALSQTGDEYHCIHRRHVDDPIPRAAEPLTGRPDHRSRIYRLYSVFCQAGISRFPRIDGNVSPPGLFAEYRIVIRYSEEYRPGTAMTPPHADHSANAFPNEEPSSPSEAPKIAAGPADSLGMESLCRELEELVRQRTEELEASREALRAEVALRKRTEAEVQRLSLTDDLTGLSNRRGFLLRAEQLLKLVNRVPTHGWLIYIDLDGLKEVNLASGRDAGDRLIRDAARVLRESFRDSDVVARIGSDEFVVFATGPSTPAAEIEERIARNIEHHNLCYPDQPAVSMCIGVIRCDPHSLHTLDEMIHQADAAMYIEKRRKRERLRDSLPG